MHDIRKRISSGDIDVLEQSLAFVRERLVQEMERGKAAEGRATAMLAILGILAGFIVPLIQSIGEISGDIKWSLIATFLGSLLFLLKGLYQAVRILGVAKKYRLQVDSVYDFQPISRADALREEIAGLVWERKKSTQPNTEKLFRLHRCQRSALMAIILFMLFGILLLVATEQWILIPLCAAYGIGAAIFLLLFVVDPAFEKLGIWGNADGTSSGNGDDPA